MIIEIYISDIGIGEKLKAKNIQKYGCDIRSDDTFSRCCKRNIGGGSCAIAFAQGGDFVGGVKKKSANFNKRVLRKAMNSLFCRTDCPIEFRGTMNEDVTTYTTLGSRGNLFFTICDICVLQLPTQSLAGGMTEAYLESGTYLKTF